MQPWHRDLHPNFAVRAYFHWINEGRPQGRDRIHWYRAVAEVDPTFPLDCIPRDLLPDLPEVRARMVVADDEETALERARREDYRDLYGTEYPGEAAIEAEMNRRANERTENAIAMGQRLLTDALAKSYDAPMDDIPFPTPAPLPDLSPTPPITVAEYVEQERVKGIPRADLIENVFLRWNETPEAELHRQFEAVWPWEAAPLGRQIADIDELHAEGSTKAQARVVFMIRHAHPFDEDKRDYARERFEMSWKNAVRRKAKTKTA